MNSNGIGNQKSNKRGNQRKENVRIKCLKTLKDLGLDCLDLYLVNFPVALKFVPFETRYPQEWFMTQKFLCGARYGERRRLCVKGGDG